MRIRQTVWTIYLQFPFIHSLIVIKNIPVQESVFLGAVRPLSPDYSQKTAKIGQGIECLMMVDVVDVYKIVGFEICDVIEKLMTAKYILRCIGEFYMPELVEEHLQK